MQLINIVKYCAFILSSGQSCLTFTYLFISGLFLCRSLFFSVLPHSRSSVRHYKTLPPKMPLLENGTNWNLYR